MITGQKVEYGSLKKTNTGWGRETVPAKKLTRLGCGLLLICTSVWASASDWPAPVPLIAAQEQVPLAGHISVLVDETARLTFDDVCSPEQAARFQRTSAASFNYGFTPDTAYWYRLKLRGATAAAASDWVLTVNTPSLDSLDFHLTFQDGTTRAIQAGDLRQVPAELLRNRNFAVPVRIAAGEEVTVHIRVATQGAAQVPIALSSARAFESNAAKDTLAYGLFFGALLVMVLYNLLIFAWTRTRAYLYYVLYIVSGGLLVCVVSGFARLYGNHLSPSAPAWISATLPLSGMLFGTFALLFMREFLQTSRHLPRTDQGLRMLLGLFGGTLLLYPLLPYTWGMKLFTYYAQFELPVLLAAGVYLATHGVRAARFYVLATSAIVAGGLVKTFETLNWLPIGPLTQYAWMAGLCLDVTLLSLALADDLSIARTQAQRSADRVNRLKSFLPQRVADLVGSGDQALLEPKRRNVTVCVIDLRGFTPFSEAAAPEDVMTVLREFYDTMGKVVEQHGGTVEHFAGDSMLIFFNAPLEIPEPEKQAVRTALEMRAAFELLRQQWAKRGHALGLGIGIAEGYATIGAIGFSGRSQYAAIGAVSNLAARLCSFAQHGDILTTPRVLSAVEHDVEHESGGEQTMKGFSKPVQVVKLLNPKP